MDSGEHMTNHTSPPDADPFDTATYYAVGDPELLSHTDPTAAIEEYLEYLHPTPLTEITSVTVKAYGRIKVSLPGNLTDWLEESVYESYTESEHADPDGTNIPLSDEDQKQFVSLLQKAVDYFCEHVEGWACEATAERVYEGDELERIKKELYPDD